jgi:hypothetical protein
MASKFLQRLTLAAVLVGALGVEAHATAAARPVRRTNRPVAARGFNLFAGAVNVMINTNRVQCNINNIGEECVDPTNSPVVGGGFWPKGTPDQYVFNAGLQTAAIIPSTAGFAWAGDTVGTYFFDPRGDQTVGQGLTNVYSSTNADDINNWPSAAYVNDPTLFHPSLLGRKSISQQDTWVRYWDGNVNLLTGRQHPMGVLVDQRSMMWNFPSGNQDIVYFIARFINITSGRAADYANLSAYGYSAADIADIVQIAQNYRAAVQAKFNLALPDSGYAFTQLYTGPEEDPDEGNSGLNYSTANLPFAMDFVYKSNFNEPNWAFPPDIFGASPFTAAPGFQANKFLKGPRDAVTHQPIGITMFTNQTNGAPFPDRQGTQALWRLASGNLIAIDGACNAPTGTPMCQLVQTAVDTRMFMYSGPLSILPGHSEVVVSSMIFAAPVGAAVQSDGLGHSLGSQSFDLKPGVPGTPIAYIQTNTRPNQPTQDTIRQIERAIGWAVNAHNPGNSAVALDTNGNGKLDQYEIPTVPRSLMNKALVAQAVFDAQFLLPFSPVTPNFYLIPGDNQVTVAWEPSLTESAGQGDPYFVVASNPLNSLYDPNFRQSDVEGYRIWRGRAESSMEVIAAFDYAGTSITDYTGAFWNSDYGNRCAPELGLDSLPSGTCPAQFKTTYPYTVGHAIPLAGTIIQVPPGGRVQLSSGDVLIVTADTAVTGNNSGLPPLRDTGVPFAYIDNTARNGFRYFYAVTAFDINSVKSGPSSLESPMATKPVTPRAIGSTAAPTVLVTGMFGGDGTQLDVNAGWPKLDSVNGTFNGPIPPANSTSLSFLASVPEALPEGDFKATIDSISPALAHGYGVREPTIYVTFTTPTDTVRRNFNVTGPSYSIAVTDTVHYETSFPFVPYDTARAHRLGIHFTQTVKMPVKFSGILWPFDRTSLGVGLAMRWPSTSSGSFRTAAEVVAAQQARFLMHSYWYDESATSQPPMPTINPFGSAAHSNGQLTGVTAIYSPNVYRQPTSGGAANHSVNLNQRAYFSQYIQYPADFVVTWGAGGAVTVRDSTHRTNLPFKKMTQVGYGFLNASAITGAGYALGDGLLDDGNAGTTFDPAVISYYSLYAIDPNCTDWWVNPICANLEQTAKISPIDITGDGVSDGNGVALIINGEPFYFLTSTLPAAGTKWHLKSVGGGFETATCTPALPSGTADMAFGAQPTSCVNYKWAPLTFRPALAPGVSFVLRVAHGFSIDSTLGDMSRIHTVPDPYYVTNSLEITANTKVLRFVNLPDRAIIRIYSVSGILVNMLTHNDRNGGGEEVWNLRNRNNQFVASGVYFYHVEAPDGRTKIGRFTVVNYAQ